MGDFERKVHTIEFGKGVNVDGVATDAAFLDMENVVPLSGAAVGLRPRAGVARSSGLMLATLPAANAGHVHVGTATSGSVRLVQVVESGAAGTAIRSQPVTLVQQVGSDSQAPDITLTDDTYPFAEGARRFFCWLGMGLLVCDEGARPVWVIGSKSCYASIKPVRYGAGYGPGGENVTP